MRVLCRRTNKEYTKYCLAYSLFQSPSSVWRTTILDAVVFPHRAISIPVLHVEDDARRCSCQTFLHHFNPRPPCGGRPQVNFKAGGGLSFQSASSVWRTTACGRLCERPTTYFNPRPPCGGRPSAKSTYCWRTYLNPRPPCGGRR